MPAKAICIEENLNEIFAQAWFSGRISFIHQQRLKVALVSNSLNFEEKMLVNRLFYAVRRGWIRVSLEAGREENETAIAIGD